MSLDLNLLKRFEAVCRLRSFSRAANDVSISHSAMTKSIALLEDALGVKLLHRTTRSIEMTEAGVRLYAEAPRLLTHAGDVKASVMSGVDTLRVIAGPVVLEALGQRAILALRNIAPGMNVSIQTGPPQASADLLIQGRADLLMFHEHVANELSGAKAFRIEPIVKESYIVLFRPGHPAERRAKSVEDWLSHEWAVPSMDPMFQSGLTELQRHEMAKRGFPKYRIQSLSVCMSLASHSDLLTLVPQSAAKHAQKVHGLRSSPFPLDVPFSVCAITLKRANLSPLINAFTAALSPRHVTPPL